MKLARAALGIHEATDLDSIIQTELAKGTSEGHAIKDFFYPEDVDYFWAEVDAEDDYDAEKFDCDLRIEKFSERILSMNEKFRAALNAALGLNEKSSFTPKEGKETAKSVPAIIKGKYFQIDGYRGDVSYPDDTETKAIKKFVVKVAASKYDEHKDSLTATVNVKSATIG